MDPKHTVLKEYFGYDTFRPGQAEIIDALTGGKDALCVMPTGAGKSLCFQVPALLFKGVTLVVSPLISLMKDQVSALVKSGVSAAYVNSSLTAPQYAKVLDRIRSGQYKIVYVAPERLLTPAFLELCKHIELCFIAIDEAHCVSQWGQDFRPDYLKIVAFINALPTRPIVGAFTATATAQVKEDIANILHLKDPYMVTTGFDRPNLFFSVLPCGGEKGGKADHKKQKLLSLLAQRQGRAGIVYCATRKAVDEVCALLVENGYAAAKYHAGMTAEERKSSQEAFVYDESPVMVATNAFGMGIDKSNVSYIIHYQMPKNIEAYYQEAGRAGRDGEKAECILLYSPQDVIINKFLITSAEPNPDLSEEQQAAIREKDFERLKQMTFYATGTECLRGFILNYFGEKTVGYCGYCSNCIAHYETVDITADAQNIIACIKSTGQRYGAVLISEVLGGSENQRLLRLGLQNQPAYGALKGYPIHKIRQIINAMLSQGILSATDSEYPVLALTESANHVLNGEERFSMKLPREQKAKREKTAAAADTPAAPVDYDLLRELKALRSELARKEHVPAYIIFTDAALNDMCRRRPDSLEAFLLVSGVGKAKQEKYGAQFLDLLARYRTASSPASVNHRDPEPRSTPHFVTAAPESPTAAVAACVDPYRRWESREDDQLRKEFASGLSVEEIAKLHQRTSGAILARLKRLDLIRPVSN